MVIAYYQILFVLSILLTLLYMMTWHKHFDVHVTLIFTMVPIAILGNLMTAGASNLTEAILANKITYFGGTFLMLMITLAILQLCDFRVPRWLRFIMFAASTLTYFGALTVGRNEWFYKSVDFANENGAGWLTEKHYGPLHAFFVGLVLAYFAISFAAMIYSAIRKKNVPNKVILLMFIPEMVAVVAFYGVRTVVTPQVELLPVAYVFAQIMYLIIIHQVCLYDITDTGIDTMVQNGDKGFVSFDFKRRYLGCNETALDIFPELADAKVDKVLPTNTVVSEQVNRWLDTFENDNTQNSFRYHYGDNSYMVTLTHLYDGKRKGGYQFFLSDDTKRQKYIELINDFNFRLKEQVAEKTQHIVEMHEKLIMGMATMVESRDNSTGGHIRRTSEGVRILTDEIRKDNTLNISEDFIRNVIKAAPMHDLGKIAVDDVILRKPGRFEPWEFEKMKAHAKEGAHIVHAILEGTDDVEFHEIAENVAHYHHERWDGSGYPEGLKGEEIPLEARIMAIADVYDALVSKRVYKDSMPFDKADSIIMEGMGTQFDPALKRFYEAARPRLEAYYSEQEAVPDGSGLSGDNSMCKKH
ncbi:MAG: HD domain-containing protein [Lachnospiraceae bacterium]|nr:HD domain-containing protein [Lachnospiraceae bacterium]